MRHRLFILITGAICTLPLILTLAMGNGAVDQREQRALADWPTIELSRQGIGRLPQQLEAWFNDHFGLRAKLVSVHDRLEYRLLGQSSRVLVGEQGWLFLKRGLRTDVEMIPIVRDLCGETPFSESQLAHWVTALDRNRRELASRGVAYVLMIVPNKHTLYRRYLPAYSHCDASAGRLQQLTKRLRTIDGFKLVDLKTPLLQASLNTAADGFVYHKTDTHWNGAGIRIAYAALAPFLDDLIDWNNMETAGRIKPNRVHQKAGDLSQMAGLADSVTESMYGFDIHLPTAQQLDNPWPRHSKDPHRQPQQWRLGDSAVASDVVVFHDSFVGRTMKTLLAESFARTRFVWQGSPTLPVDILDDDPPDLVIHEMVERNLLQPW